MSSVEYDVVVVGAGAAGLMAAIFAARSGAGVVAIDGARKVGAKILISGGGRCNVTHHAVAPEDFTSTNRNLLARVLRSFDVPETTSFFEEIGVELKREETGKLFPVTDQARTVLDALVEEMARSGAEIRTDHRVERIDVLKGGDFAVVMEEGAILARKVVLATGGRSLPKSGSDGHGYALARAMGHSVEETFPALVPLLIDGAHWMKELKGTSCDVELSLTSETGKVVRRIRGSMLFTHFGLSGPAILDMSRHWIAFRNAGKKPSLRASFMPGLGFAETDEWLLFQANERPRSSVSTLLRQHMTERLVEALAKEAGIESRTSLGRLTKEDRRALVHVLLETALPVTDHRGFRVAEVTAGGIPLSEVDVGTMESKIQPNLYLCGEILDVDGRIGGFNFQWAWASGRLAGNAAGERE